MPDDDLERKVRKLSVEHAETRWLALRVDDDIQEIRTTLKGHTARLDRIDGRLDAIEGRQTEHTARFDSIDSQFRSLTQLVGRALDRLPEDPAGH